MAAERQYTEEEPREEGTGSIGLHDILGGGWLKKGIAAQWPFILYVFFLLIVYISINLGVEKTQVTRRRNQHELKNLKADYTGKAARLQDQSKRGEIEIKLIRQGSSLHKPSKPARRIQMP